MAFNGPVVAYGDSVAKGIARANHIKAVAEDGQGLGYHPDRMPSVKAIPKDAAVLISVGWNDREYVNGGWNGKIDNYNAYVAKVAEKIEEIKKQTGGPVVLLKLEPGANDMGEYGNKREIAKLNRALEEAAQKTGITTITPNTNRKGPDPHYTANQSKKIFEQVDLALNQSPENSLMVAKNESTINLSSTEVEPPPIAHPAPEPAVIKASVTVEGGGPRASTHKQYAVNRETSVTSAALTTNTTPNKADTPHPNRRRNDDHPKTTAQAQHHHSHHQVAHRRVVKHEDDLITALGRTFKKYFGSEHHDAPEKPAVARNHPAKHQETADKRDAPKHRTAAYEEGRKLADAGIDKVHHDSRNEPQRPFVGAAESARGRRH